MKQVSKQVNKETTKLLRIDTGWHQNFKVEAAKRQTSMKELTDEAYSEWWSRHVMGKNHEK